MRGRTLIVLVVLLTIPARLWAWGYEGHRIVARGAIEIAPQPLRAFLERHADEIIAHSVDPDLWAEKKVLAPPWTHYIDLDMLDTAPFDRIPREYDEALAKYGPQMIEKAGTLPWEIARRERQLSEAMRAGQWDNAVREASWIGHYIADSTMPLHTTKDYRGEAAGNIVLKERGPHRSAHQRLEVGLIERFPKIYEAVRGDPGNVRRESALGMAWRTVRESFALIPAALRADREASDVDCAFGATFYSELESRQGEAMRRQIARAQELLASAWLTAWEDAGRPALPERRLAVIWPDVVETPRARKRADDATTLAVVLSTVVALLVVLLRARRRRRRIM